MCDLPCTFHVIPSVVPSVDTTNRIHDAEQEGSRVTVGVVRKVLHDHILCCLCMDTRKAHYHKQCLKKN